MAAKIESPDIIARNIKDWNISVPEQTYMVVIHCSTYNHGKFIEDALKGFVMQQTNFSFCAIVIDDASTDNNAEIIRRYAKQYPDIIKPICLGYNHMQNNLSRNPYFDSWHKSAKYIAQCEGDDYWIDPLKLQKQVDFLEANEDFSLSHTAFLYQVEYAENKIMDSKLSSNKNLFILNNDYSNIIAHILSDNKYRIQTVTALYRKDKFDLLEEDKRKRNQPVFLLGDTPLWIGLIKYGKVHFLEDETSVYRLHMGSACRQEDPKKQLRFILSCAEMRVYFSTLMDLDNIYIEKFMKEYRKALLNYKSYDISYKEFIPLKFSNDIESYIYQHILMSNIGLYFNKYIFKLNKSYPIILIKLFYNKFLRIFN